MLARVYGAAKVVGQLAQKAGLADNNFAHLDFDVDNYPVVPELSPALSTDSRIALRNPRKKARSPSKNSGPWIQHR
jgi:hypothetical protein